MHLSDGTLRRSLDEPFVLDEVHRRHLEACPRCTRRGDAIRAESQGVTALFAAVAIPEVDTGAALRGAHARLPEVEVRRPGRRSWLRDPRRRARVTRRSAATLAVAGACVALVGAGAAGGFITIFQPEQFTPVTVSAADAASLQELASYGDVSGIPNLTLTPVSRAEAQALTGVTPADLSSLPPGIPNAPTYAVVSGGTVSFTFDEAKAQAAAQRAGATLPPMPAAIDGSTLQLTLPSVLVEAYGVDLGHLLQSPDQALGQQGLLVVASELPRVTSTGASAGQIEDYLLAQPGFPADLASEIRAISDPSTTLPIPIPLSLASTQTVSVDGAPGLLIGDQTGIGSLVLWQKGGVVRAVAGSVSADGVLRVADQIG
ncbi:MAG: hypothetical protein ACLQT7_07930 [Candidatus Dormibacteria bacterium]